MQGEQNVLDLDAVCSIQETVHIIMKYMLPFICTIHDFNECASLILSDVSCYLLLGYYCLLLQEIPRSNRS